MDKITGFKLSHWIFWIVALTPLTILLYVTLLFGIRLYQINHVDEAKLFSELKNAFEKHSPYNPFFKGEDGKTFYHSHKDAKPQAVAFQPDVEEATAYLFGASSLVMPFGEKVLSDYLSELLNSKSSRRWRVYNFGNPGLSSDDVLNCLQSATRLHRPELIIAYFGHNDYTVNYIQQINPNFFLFPEGSNLRKLMRVFYDYAYQPSWTLVGEKADREFSFYLRADVEPRFNQLLIRSHLLSIDQKMLEKANRMILENYKRIVGEFIRDSAGKGIATILITPVGNLEAPVHGTSENAIALFDRAMEESDASKRLHMLKEVKELDAFSPSIRAKNGMHEFIVGLKAENLSVLDLERKMDEHGVWPGYNTFMDYVHFKPELHHLIAEEIMDVMIDRGLLKDPKETTPE